MKPPAFSYHDPRSTADVLGLLTSLDNAKLLAGGQSLMPMLNMRFVLPDHVVDLNRVEGLDYIRDADGALEIGAMTRQCDIEFSELVRTRCPLMHEAIAQVGHRQTRNRGTLGGSLCHLDPAAELVAVAATLDATVTVAGKDGTRTVAFADFPVAYMTPAVGADELLVGARFPCWREPHGYAFVEFSRRHGDFAIVSAAALIEEDNAGKVTRAALTLGGLGAAPVRARAVERALIGETINEQRLREICEPLRQLEAMDDIHAPASYRQQLATVLSRRAFLKAHERLVEKAHA
ncbi:MAG: xanthine dehydrogenase family protein subunit M [Xanthobacteraceae bacterium]